MASTNVNLLFHTASLRLKPLLM